LRDLTSNKDYVYYLEAKKLNEAIIQAKEDLDEKFELTLDGQNVVSCNDHLVERSISDDFTKKSE